MSCESEAIRLSTGLKVDRPEALMPCNSASSLNSLNRDIAAANGLGSRGSSSCAPSVSIKRIGTRNNFPEQYHALNTVFRSFYSYAEISNIFYKINYDGQNF